MFKHGLTLIETAVVIAIIAILALITIPTVSALQRAFADRCSPSTISTLLNSVRTTASLHQKYTGIRFQQKNSVQYAIKIIHSSKIPYSDDPEDRTIPFIALDEPTNLGTQKSIVSDTNKVTVLFSPQGKLVKKWVQIFSNPELQFIENGTYLYNDEVFSSTGLFTEDTNPQLSSNSFIIKTPKSSKTFYINPYTGRLINE